MNDADAVGHEPGLEAELARHTNDNLLPVARIFTGKPPTNKRDLVAFLSSQTRPPHLAATLERCGDAGRKVLAAAAYGNGMLRTALKAVPGFKPGHWMRSWSSSARDEKPSPVILFFPDGCQMPTELRRLLAELLPAPARPPMPVLAGDPPGQVAPSDPLGDIGLILHLAKSEGLPIAQKTLLPATLKRLATSATAVTGSSAHRPGDHARLDALVRLLVRGGLLFDNGKIYRPRQDAIGHAELKRIVTGYVTSGEDEVQDLTSLRGRGKDWVAWTDPHERRAELIQAIGFCPIGAWIPVGEFIARTAAIAAIEPLLRIDPFLSFGKGYGCSLDELGESGLNLIRAAWVRVVLFTRLAPLGVVEIAVGEPAPPPAEIRKHLDEPTDFPVTLSPADTLTAFRVTALGAWLLGFGPEPAPETAKAEVSTGWRIQSDGTVVNLGQKTASGDRLLLDRLGERLDERSWRLQRAQILALLADSAGRETGETLRKKLETLTGTVLPDLVLRLIDDAQRRVSAVVTEGLVVLLRVSDRPAAEQLLHDRATAQLCRDLGGGFIAVEMKNFDPLRRAARKLGWHVPDAITP